MKSSLHAIEEVIVAAEDEYNPGLDDMQIQEAKKTVSWILILLQMK